MSGSTEKCEDDAGPAISKDKGVDIEVGKDR
jgi:hypothetical protein